MKSCCCGTGQQPNDTCDPCPPPFDGFDDIKYRVTVVSAGIVNCACGDGVNAMTNQNIGGGEFAGGCPDEYLSGGPCNTCLNTTPGFLDGADCGFRTLRMTSVTWPNNYQQIEDCRDDNGCVPLFCDVCAPSAVQSDPLPASTHTLEITGCVYHQPCPGDPLLPGCVGYSNPNLCTVHPNYCASVNAGHIDDFIGDGVTFMKIHRCVRPGSCSVGGGGTWNCSPVHGSLNGQTYSAVVVEFVGPDVTYYDSYIDCVPNPQGGKGTLSCFQFGPYTLAPQYWTCIYAKPQRACDWFAEGGYQLVGYSTNGCVGSWKIQNDPNTPNCDFEPCTCVGKLSDCDWENGVDTGEMASKWKPPSSITVIRLQ